MSLFLSTFTNKVDAKSRVSVPAAFRGVVSKEDDSSIVLYRSFVNKCIEGCTLSRIEMISASIDNLDPYSEERDAFATLILGECEQVKWDKDGRIVLSAKLLEYADIKSQAVFVGKGKSFELWEPDLFAEHKVKIQEIAKKKRDMLKLH